LYGGAPEPGATTMNAGEWFLSAAERGNRWSAIDADRSPMAWSEGNAVTALVDGRCYFDRLLAVFNEMQAGDLLLFTDWRGDGDEQIGDRISVAHALAALCRRGADVRGLVWRSHSDRVSFSERENRRIADEVVAAGGEVLLDERVRRGGSHHQKLVVARHGRRPDRDVAFVGGIDLCHGRRDHSEHDGDPQPVELDERYGARPPWHDVQLEVRGPAVADLELTFRERWCDPTPLNHSGAIRAWFSRIASRERTPLPLPPALPAPPVAGSRAVQVLRTYPARRPEYEFAPGGERSVARAFLKAIAAARHLVYIEDQYFWSAPAAHALARAVRTHPELRVIVVLPRHPDRDGFLSGGPARRSQSRALHALHRAAPDRVAVYDIESEQGVPIYVHAKVCIVDDTWATVGSDNLNRRSWTHDSELSCAVVDDGPECDSFARDLRLTLWSEHLALPVDHVDIVGVERGFDTWKRAARDLDQWHRTGCGPRPRGRARVHEPAARGAATRVLDEALYRLLIDPDGRPARLHLSTRY